MILSRRRSFFAKKFDQALVLLSQAGKLEINIYIESSMLRPPIDLKLELSWSLGLFLIGVIFSRDRSPEKVY